MVGVTFDEKHSYHDFGLVLTGTELNMPQPKTHTVEIPCADGVLDLTDQLTGGEMKYDNRSLTFTFTVINSARQWPAVLAQVSAYLHGQKRKITCDVDKEHYYLGRCAVNKFASDKRTAKLVVACDVEPYKYDVSTSGEAWRWDGFSFLDGVIRAYKEILVTGQTAVRVIGTGKTVAPAINCTGNMTLTVNGEAYSLKAGKNKNFGLLLRPGETLFQFNGTGKVTISFRGVSF